MLNRYNRKYIKRKSGGELKDVAYLMWRAVLMQRKSVAVLLFLIILREVLAMIPRVLFALLLASIADPEGKSSTTALYLIAIFGCNAGIIFVNAHANSLTVWTINYVLPHKLQAEIVSHANRLGAAFHTAVPHSQISNKINSVDKLVDLELILFWDVIGSSTQVLMSMGTFLLIMPFNLGLIMSAIVLVATVGFGRLTMITTLLQMPDRRRRKDKEEDIDEEVSVQLHEYTTMLLAQPALTAAETSLVTHQRHHTRVGFLESNKGDWFPGILRNVILLLGRASVLAVAVIFFNRGQIELENVLAAQTIGETMFIGIWGMAYFFYRLANSSESLSRLAKFLAVEPYVIEPLERVEFPAQPINIAVDGVSFYYPDRAVVSGEALDETRAAIALANERYAHLSRYATASAPYLGLQRNEVDGSPEVDSLTAGQLSDVSFTIAAGEVVAFVGATGSGKSTIVKLLSKLYVPNSGTIYINGVPTTEMHGDDIRRHLAIVPQKAGIVSATLIENVVMERRGSKYPCEVELRVKRCLEKANLWEKVAAWPNHMYTIIGGRGEDLSGGEAQRLAIARALYRASRDCLLILDEATAALDTVTEQMVQQSVDTLLREGMTAIVIAHRLSTIRNVDRIYVLDNGSIVESGRWDDLLALNGRFAKLVAAQNIAAR